MQQKKIFIISAVILLLVLLVVGVCYVLSKEARTPESPLPAVTNTDEEIDQKAVPVDNEPPEDDEELPPDLTDAELLARIEAMTMATATSTRPLSEEEKRLLVEDYKDIGDGAPDSP